MVRCVTGWEKTGRGEYLHTSGVWVLRQRVRFGYRVWRVFGGTWDGYTHYRRQVAQMWALMPDSGYKFWPPTKRYC